MMISYKAYFFYEMNTNNFNDLDNTYNEFIFKEITEIDFKKNALFQQKDRMKRYIHFIQHGHRCFGFFDHSNNVVSYLWLSTAGKVAPFTAFIQLRIGDGLAYIWDCRTSDEYRGKGLYKEGLKRLIQFVASLNGCRIRICNLSTNEIANKTMCSLNFNYAHTIRVFRFLFLTIVIGYALLPKFVLKNKLQIDLVSDR